MPLRKEKFAWRMQFGIMGYQKPRFGGIFFLRKNCFLLVKDHYFPSSNWIVSSSEYCSWLNEILSAKKQQACSGPPSDVDKSKFWKGFEKKPKRKFKNVYKENDQSQSLCVKFSVEFESGKNGDFMKCWICQIWVCENCYVSECCVNCDE